MKKHVILFIIILNIIIIVGSIAILFLLYNAQYNSKGISHLLIITIDQNQPKEYIGKLDGFDVYIEKLKLEDLCFRSFDAKNVPIKYAIDNNLVSTEDWKKHAFYGIVRESNSETIINENYEIYISGNECIIRPITYKFY